MGNVIKVRLKKTTEVGISGITTNTFEAGLEGFVVDAIPTVRDGNLIADIAVLFPDLAHVAAFQAHELEVIESPGEKAESKLGLIRMISDMVSLSFEMHDSGVDLSFLSSMRRKQADKANDAPTP